MLTPAIMGLLGLAVMWTATSLITAVAWSDLVRLLRRSRRLARTTYPVVVTSPVLAELEVVEVGRARRRARRPTILFHPQRQSCRIDGGKVSFAGKLIEIPPLDASASEVWPRSTGAAGPTSFDDAYREASRAKGLTRTVTHVYKEGDRVFVAGDLRTGPGGALTLAPAPDPTRPGDAPTVLVAADDPRAWVRRKILLSTAGIAGFVGSAGVVTLLAFAEPGFGRMTTVAGLLGLAQFLIAQPLGVALRAAVRAPDRAVVHRDLAAA